MEDGLEIQIVKSCQTLFVRFALCQGGVGCPAVQVQTAEQSVERRAARGRVPGTRRAVFVARVNSGRNHRDIPENTHHPHSSRC